MIMRGRCRRRTARKAAGRPQLPVAEPGVSVIASCAGQLLRIGPVPTRANPAPSIERRNISLAALARVRQIARNSASENHRLGERSRAIIPTRISIASRKSSSARIAGLGEQIQHAHLLVIDSIHPIVLTQALFPSRLVMSGRWPYPRGTLVVTSQHRTVHRPLPPPASLPKQAVRRIGRKDVTVVRWDDHSPFHVMQRLSSAACGPSRTPHDTLGARPDGIGGSSESATLTASVIPKATKSAFRSRASASEVSPSSFSAPGADQNTIPTRDAGRVRFSRLTTNLACLSELVLRNPTTIA